MKFSKEMGEILFDGYWKGGAGGDHKKRMGKTEPKPYEEAIEKFPYLLGKVKSHIVMTDYDDLDSFQCRLNIAIEEKQHCIAIKSPNKGGHIYWFNQNQAVTVSNTKNKTALTFAPVDYKCGIKIIRSTGEIKDADNYGSISTEDKAFREVVYCSIREDNTLDEIPFYDLSIKAGEKFNFLGMGEGDGRQDGLFTYMNPIKAAGYSYEQFKIIAELIEQYLFSVPLGEEFENAIRQEAWENLTACNDSLFFNGSAFLFNKFGDYIIEKYHVKKINGYMHSYEDGVYIQGYEPIEKLILDEIPSLTKTKRNEVLEYLRIRAEEKPTTDLHLIPFKNGVYNLDTDQLDAFNPAYIITNRIPWNYNPDAKSELVDSTLNKLACDDENIRYSLEEVAGACLYRSCNLGGGMATILVGDKHNGKSTYIHLIEGMLGKMNYSALDIKELGDRFSTIMLYGKLANIGDDISNDFINDVSVFKKLCTGDTIKAEEKGRPAINFVSYAMQIYSANDIPHMKDRTGAALRRLLLIPLNGKFTKNTPDYDPFIINKLTQPEHMEYFIQLALDGLEEVLNNKCFTVPEAVQKKKDEYEVENNPILAFIEDEGKDSIINEATAEVYKRYQVFCVENGFQAGSNLTFSKGINRALGTESKQKKINKKNIKIFAMVSE